jgi:nicotinamidase/pyrazinamidase
MKQPIHLDPNRSALLIVDMQPDFMPGGALPVQTESGAIEDELIAPIGALMNAGLFAVQVATQDWHPPGHKSFASAHHGKRPFETITLNGQQQILWPDHCLQGSPGAQLHSALPTERLVSIIRKGADPETDSYSGLRDNRNPNGERPPTGLGGYLRERGVDSVFCCGLARDVCVRWTARDAAEEGFSTHFIWDLTRPVDPANDDEVRTELESKGVRIIVADQVRCHPDHADSRR